MTVRDAILKICSDFDDDYWMEHDQTETYPHELHAALAKDGWIGIALPEDLGGAGLGISEATMMMQSIAESGAGLAGAQSIHAKGRSFFPRTRTSIPGFSFYETSSFARRRSPCFSRYFPPAVAARAITGDLLNSSTAATAAKVKPVTCLCLLG